MYSKTLPERTPLPRPSSLGDQQEQRLRVALERQGLGARRIREELQPVAKPERLGPGAIGLAEVAEEARDDVEPRVGERLEKRPRVAASEEAPGVRDAEAVRGMALEADDVVEVGAVRDRHDRALRVERPRLLADRLRDADDRVGARGNEPRDALVQGRFRLRRRRVRPPVRMRDERVAEIGDPADAGRSLNRGRDQMRRAGRRRGEDDVDPVLAHQPDRRRGPR